MDFHLKLDVTIKDLPSDVERHSIAGMLLLLAQIGAMRGDEGGDLSDADLSVTSPITGGWEIEMTGE